MENVSVKLIFWSQTTDAPDDPFSLFAQFEKGTE